VTHQLNGIHHVQLAMPPGEEDRARRFYGDVLGLEEVPKPKQLAARGGCWFRGQGVELHLGVEAGFTPARKAHPAFVVRDLSSVRRALEEAGIEVVDDTELDGFRRFYGADPFGNRLEFLERG
jgi:catechol 2,3-dioxygenase-like lactoylglutathione lyase family enzyme